MSELINIRDSRATIRWKLLTSASALALTAYVSSATLAKAEDTDRPLVWVELGGQLEQLSDAQEIYNPPFMTAVTRKSLLSGLNVQAPQAYGLDEEGAISFQPGGSDWVFSASVRYGRSSAHRHLHHQTDNTPVPVATGTFYGFPFGGFSLYPKGHVKFSEGRSTQSESRLVLDFQAGKDVGLGIFGADSSSVLSAGVRFAQFNSRTLVNLRVEPDVQYPTAPLTTFFQYNGFKYSDPIRFHDFAGLMAVQRNFHGVGPSLAWKSSVPFAGSENDGELTLDWGINGAVLFGKQRVQGHHQSTTRSYYGTNFHRSLGARPHYKSGSFMTAALNTQNIPGLAHQSSHAANFHRTRAVTVPNLGGFAGISYRYSDAKISLGYRADFFFGAIDGGIDTRKEENRGFFGPYASISFGIGD